MSTDLTLTLVSTILGIGSAAAAAAAFLGHTCTLQGLERHARLTLAAALMMFGAAAALASIGGTIYVSGGLVWFIIGCSKVMDYGTDRNKITRRRAREATQRQAQLEQNSTQTDLLDEQCNLPKMPRVTDSDVAS